MLTGPTSAQTLLKSFEPEKTPQQKVDEELREQFSKRTSSKVLEPNSKPSSVDPWGNARGTDVAKVSNPKQSKPSRPFQ
jgi:hypothetical protein